MTFSSRASSLASSSLASSSSLPTRERDEVRRYSRRQSRICSATLSRIFEEPAEATDIPLKNQKERRHGVSDLRIPRASLLLAAVQGLTLDSSASDARNLSSDTETLDFPRPPFDTHDSESDSESDSSGRPRPLCPSALVLALVLHTRRRASRRTGEMKGGRTTSSPLHARARYHPRPTAAPFLLIFPFFPLCPVCPYTEDATPWGPRPRAAEGAGVSRLRTPQPRVRRRRSSPPFMMRTPQAVQKKCDCAPVPPRTPVPTDTRSGDSSYVYSPSSSNSSSPTSTSSSTSSRLAALLSPPPFPVQVPTDVLDVEDAEEWEECDVTYSGSSRSLVDSPLSPSSPSSPSAGSPSAFSFSQSTSCDSPFECESPSSPDCDDAYNPTPAPVLRPRPPLPLVPLHPLLPPPFAVEGVFRERYFPAPGVPSFYPSFRSFATPTLTAKGPRTTTPKIARRGKADVCVVRLSRPAPLSTPASLFSPTPARRRHACSPPGAQWATYPDLSPALYTAYATQRSPRRRVVVHFLVFLHLHLQLPLALPPTPDTLSPALYTQRSVDGVLSPQLPAPRARTPRRPTPPRPRVGFERE
ncbi:hypothetical protein C8R44DRAFT_991995 [Mycena epipterygia]|nr:hypothetical protein C8R44DRAFT_991995 [Mycena epipterygia]